MSEEKKYWVAFSVFPGIGPVRFGLLHKYFGSAAAAWTAPASEYKAIGLGERLTAKFLQFRASFVIDEYLNELRKKQIFILTADDPRYPARLKEISDAPFVIYVKGKRGDEPLDLSRAVAVVGTRRITDYGREATEKIVRGLVAAGCTIVSGLAYGVDAVAHQTALDCGGKTVAVLGCGVDLIAPPSNAGLYAQIAGGGGAIISEMPLGLRPNKGLFPARNRIISGLSLGVVVTQGADDSGALITARYAAEQGRDVFAVPGPITSPYSRGPFKLIKDGATLVESAEDVLEVLQISKKNLTDSSNLTNLSNLNEIERKIVASLEKRRLTLDELIRSAGLTTAAVSATLSILEIRGVVRNFGENGYGIIDDN